MPISHVSRMLGDTAGLNLKGSILIQQPENLNYRIIVWYGNECMLQIPCFHEPFAPRMVRSLLHGAGDYTIGGTSSYY
jgi:hypothetical protein